jgi:hypothetical protein
MTRTWLQCILQQNDTDRLSYDFAESIPIHQTWWFRCGIAAVCLGLAWFIGSIMR